MTKNKRSLGFTLIAGWGAFAGAVMILLFWLSVIGVLLNFLLGYMIEIIRKEIGFPSFSTPIFMVGMFISGFLLGLTNMNMIHVFGLVIDQSFVAALVHSAIILLPMIIGLGLYQIYHISWKKTKQIVRRGQ